MSLVTVTDRKGCPERITGKSEPWALRTDEVRDRLQRFREMQALMDEALPLEVKPAAFYRQER